MTFQFERSRGWPPDYVSAETLAYRLDCSRATIDTYVKLRLLPQPQIIGNLQRWDFDQVRSFIMEQNLPAPGGEIGTSASGNEDAYMKGLRDGAATKG
jgi:predicted DNA-binding transcriptional regulator AlpA